MKGNTHGVARAGGYVCVVEKGSNEMRKWEANKHMQMAIKRPTSRVYRVLKKNLPRAPSSRGGGGGERIFQLKRRRRTLPGLERAYV